MLRYGDDTSNHSAQQQPEGLTAIPVRCDSRTVVESTGTAIIASSKQECETAGNTK